MTVPTYRENRYRQLTIVPIIGRIFVISCFIGLSLFAAYVANARPAPPSGGPRGGQAIGSGGFGRSGSGSLQRPSGLQKPSGQTAKQGGTANGNSSARTANSGNSATTTRNNATAAGNGNGNTGTVNSKNGNGNGNVNASNNGNTGVVNTGNVAVGNDVNVDVDTHGYGGGYYGGAYATGVAVGATTTAVATTSAIAVGTYYSTLPTGCAPYYLGGYRYYSCSGTWYQQTYKSGSTTYVVVTDPTK